MSLRIVTRPTRGAGSFCPVPRARPNNLGSPWQGLGKFASFSHRSLGFRLHTHPTLPSPYEPRPFLTSPTQIAMRCNQSLRWTPATQVWQQPADRMADCPARFARGTPRCSPPQGAGPRGATSRGGFGQARVDSALLGYRQNHCRGAKDQGLGQAGGGTAGSWPANGISRHGGTVFA